MILRDKGIRFSMWVLLRTERLMLMNSMICCVIPFLDDAIKLAVTITQRNYKFVVPMYRPLKDAIQLLMPIYLEETFHQRPDFALVLTPDVENELYTPETILPLDAAYQNARLIAKPDETWLNPDKI